MECIELLFLGHLHILICYKNVEELGELSHGYHLLLLIRFKLEPLQYTLHFRVCVGERAITIFVLRHRTSVCSVLPSRVDNVTREGS